MTSSLHGLSSRETYGTLSIGAAMTSPEKHVLIVGVGSIGERHLRCFQRTGRVRLSLCEINPELRRRIADQYGVERAYADLDSALADPPDAAVIATPASLHIPMAIQLAEAGTHVLIEKPLSTGLDGIDELRETVARRKVCVAVAYVLRHHPALRAMREAIRSGRFGRPVQVVVVTGQHFPKYRPAYREIYYRDRAMGGGAIQDALTHTMNAVQWLVGPIDRLIADAAHQVLEGVEVEDTAHLLARHGDVLASYSLNQYQAPNELTITVVGTEGTCRLELHRHRWAWMTEPDTPWQEQTFEGLQRDDLFVAQANAFLDMLDGEAEPTCGLEEAIQTLKANLAALASADDGQWKLTGNK
ncbi:MAG: Gfo/Idh/MocA family oxidoreductase [Planctomycetes bacterium]|nr:Gfo/Idh/MocA family oxidoreductase [Planctomycetota bacterium]